MFFTVIIFFSLIVFFFFPQIHVISKRKKKKRKENLKTCQVDFPSQKGRLGEQTARTVWAQHQVEWSSWPFPREADTAGDTKSLSAQKFSLSQEESGPISGYSAHGQVPIGGQGFFGQALTSKCLANSVWPQVSDLGDSVRNKPTA